MRNVVYPKTAYNGASESVRIGRMPQIVYINNKDSVSLFRESG